jgi:UDP-N-acetylglucosamine pyrophosphorylase
MLEWLKKSMASLNLDISENEKSMPITTYLINTKELIKYIGESIDKFLLKNKKVTEFFIFYLL